jgi:putative inorganic carbon (hco3(-)) transporter
MAVAGRTAALNRTLSSGGPALAPAVLIAVLAVAGVLGALALRMPLVAVVLPVAALGALLLMTKLDASLVLVLFLLYSNAAGVAVRVHGAPVLIAGLFPLLLGIPLIHRVVVRKEPIVLTPAVPFLAVFMLVSTLSAALSRDSTRSFDTVLTLVLEGAVLYFLVTNAIRTPAALRLAFWTLLAAGAAMGALTLFQELTGTQGDDYFGFAQVTTAFRVAQGALAGDVLQGRAAGPIGEMNFYAQIMLVLLPLGLALVSSERNTVLRLLALGMVALVAAGVVLTFSRGAAVGFAVTTIVAILLRLVGRRQVLLIVAGAALLLALFPAYVSRLATLDITEADASFQSRATENQSALLAFVDHPLIGVGPGVFPTYYREYIEDIGGRFTGDTREAHNLYLGVAAETGLIGALAFLAMLLVTLRRLFVVRRGASPPMGEMATALIISMLLFLSTSVFLHLAYERYFWFLLALEGAAGMMSARRATAVRAPGVPGGTAVRRRARVPAEPAPA